MITSSCSTNDISGVCYLRAYLAYYNTARPHQALGDNSPHPRNPEPPAAGRIVAIPQVGGLHHRYQRAA